MPSSIKRIYQKKDFPSSNSAPYFALHLQWDNKHLNSVDGHGRLGTFISLAYFLNILLGDQMMLLIMGNAQYKLLLLT